MDTDARERLAEALTGSDPLLAEQLILHTCHRVEKVGLVANGQAPDLSPGSRRFTGLAAVERVFLVAGGFDSAVMGEEQILGQVRDAFREAQETHSTGPVLSELMRRAIRFGRRVRSEARPGGDRSLAERAGRWLVERQAPGTSAEPAGTSAEPAGPVEAPATEARAARALVIGTGEMGRRLAELLAGSGATVTVASRHLPRAERLAASLPGAGHTPVALDDLLAGPLAFDVVAIAVRDATTPVGPEHVREACPLVIDLSAPRTVTAEAAQLLGDRLLDLDRLGVAEAGQTLAPSAERRLRKEAAREAARFAEWLELRASGGGVALLRAHGEEVRRRHVARLAARLDLNESQAAAVDAMAAALVGELLHRPSVELSRDPDAAQRVRDVFGIG